MTNQLEELRKIARTAADAIGEIEAEARRAENGKLVGKYFQRRDSYGCPEKPSDYWTTYAFVTRMDEAGYLHSMQFEIDKNGQIRAIPEQHSYHMQGWQPCSRAGFKRAVSRTKAALANMLAVAR